MIEIVLLGTGNPIPDPDRAGPATLICAGDANLLIDCGRAVLQRAAAIHVQANELTAVSVTHLHSDHLTDLNDIIMTRWITTFSPDPTPIFGPAPLGQVVDGILASLAPDIAYRIAHHADLSSSPPVDAQELTSGVVFDDGDVLVVAGRTEHPPVKHSVAFRVEHCGRAVVVAGDTVPCPGLDELCIGADALVHTIARDDLLVALPFARVQDVRGYHSSVAEAPRTATRAGVGTLVLTHFVPDLAPGTEDVWVGQARKHLDGRVELGNDLLKVFID